MQTMERPTRELCFLVAVLALLLILAGCQGLTGSSGPIDLTVKLAGAQTGAVSSSPDGIACGQTCTATFQGGTVTLTASPLAGSNFAGWSGACSGTGSCTISKGGTQSVKIGRASCREERV